MGLLNDAFNGLFFDAAPPTAAFDSERPNHRGYHLRMELRVVLKRSPVTVLARHIFAASIDNVTRTPMIRNKTHPTAGGFVIDWPAITAEGLVHYAIRGTTGVWPNGVPTPPPSKIGAVMGALGLAALQDDGSKIIDTEEKGAKIDGMGHVKELEDLITRYLRPYFIAGDGQEYARHELQMEFYNPDEPVSKADAAGDSSYIVVPSGTGLVKDRTAQRPSLWPFTLKLVAYKRPTVVPSLAQIKMRDNAWWEDALGIINDLNAFSFDQMFSKYQLLTGPIVRASTILGDIKRNLQGWVGGTSTFLAYNIGLLTDLADATLALTRDIDVTLGLDAGDRFGADAAALRGVQEMAAQSRRLANGMAATPSVLNQAPGGTDTLGTPRAIGQLTNFRQALNAQQANPGRAPRVSWPINVAQGTDHQPPADRDLGVSLNGNRDFATRVVIVKPGDAMEDFVPSGFTVAAVVQMNNLLFPYVDGTRPRPISDPLPSAPLSPRVAYIGETLVVPSAVRRQRVIEGSGASAAASARDPQLVENERLFGIDIFVNADGDMELDPASGDIRLVGGTDNLIQALINLVKMDLGALHSSPLTGSYLTQAVWITPLDVRLAAIAIARTLKQDHRVVAIRHLVVEARSGRLNMVIEIDAVSGRPVDRFALTV